MDLKDRLYELISDNFRSQAEAADRLGMKRQNLSSLIKNERLSYGFAKKLKTVVPKLDLNWLFTGDGDKYLGEEEKLLNNDKKHARRHRSLETEIIDLLKNQIEDLRDQVKFLQGQIVIGRQNYKKKGE